MARLREFTDSLTHLFILLPTDLLCADACQVVDGPVRLMPIQLFKPGPSRGDSQDPGADGPPAADIQRGIANHQHLFSRKRPSKHTAATVTGDRRDLVAIFAVVREGAGLKFVPKVEVPQFDFGSEPDVARQQAEQGRGLQGLKPRDELRDAWTHFGFAVAEDIIEAKNVAMKEALEIFRSGLDQMELEKLAHHAQVGAPGKFEAFKAVHCPEFLREDFGKGRDARAPGVDERAVNIKQNEPNHRVRN